MGVWGLSPGPSEIEGQRPGSASEGQSPLQLSDFYDFD